MAKKKSKGTTAIEAITQASNELHENELVAIRRERPKDLVTVSSGAGYWKFDEKPVFQGHYMSEFKSPKDLGKGKAKKGDVIGYNFVDPETGEQTIISNSYSIEKALKEDGFKTSTLWWIEFLEKTEVNGKPFNRFYIGKSK